MERIIATVLLLLSFSFSYACNCGGKKGLEKSDVVFKGEVLSIRVVDSVSFDIQFHYKATFKLDTVIKGDIQAKTVTITMSACPIEMAVGEKYIVYALYAEYFDLGKVLQTSSCTETHKLL